MRQVCTDHKGTCPAEPGKQARQKWVPLSKTADRGGWRWGEQKLGTSFRTATGIT